VCFETNLCIKDTQNHPYTCLYSINVHPYIYIHTYISVYVVMLYSAIFTQITRIIIYFDHFRYSKDKDVGMQMKPFIPSKEWYLCFSSRKTNEYATDKKLRGECFHSAIFHACYAYYYLFWALPVVSGQLSDHRNVAPHSLYRMV